MMEIIRVERVQQMQPMSKIHELIKVNRVETLAKLGKLITDYLSVNIKGTAIKEPFAFKLLLENIVNEYSYLEMQEIDYIFKRGILGKYGKIYNDISIDTICGSDGWIDTYIKEERENKPKPKPKLLQGGERITAEEYYRRHPELKAEREKRDIRYRVAINDVSIDMIKCDKEQFTENHRKIWEREFNEHISFDAYLQVAIKNEILKNL